MQFRSGLNERPKEREGNNQDGSRSFSSRTHARHVLTQFDFRIVGQQYVLPFDVSMDDFVGVEVSQAAEDFPAYVGNPFLLETLTFGSCSKNNKVIPIIPRNIPRNRRGVWTR